MFHLDFPKFTALDFSIGVFDFQNEIDMAPTHVTASVVGRQQYSRPGHSDIYHGRARQLKEGVFRESCLNNHQNSRIDC